MNKKLKLNVPNDVKKAILLITEKEPTPFFLRKKHMQDSLEMVFYTKKRAGDSNQHRVTVGAEVLDDIQSRQYYIIDKNMNLTALSPKGRGPSFTLEPKR